MNQEVIREGMRDVFGSFEDFHRNLATAANRGAIYGVVQNPPPLRQPMVNNGHNHMRNTSSPQPSARECIQRMTSDLIPSAPILPLDKSLPAFNKSYLSAPPSSSSRSTPEQIDQKKTAAKRKTKTDSDSEVERGRDRIKRAKEPFPVDNKPGTSQGSKPSGARGEDRMRELFGDDEKDCLKAISPDSGVHSTENELLNEYCNTQSILNLFTKVSSPLSPLPLDKGLTAKAVKDRMGKENKEKREKEEVENRRIAQEQKEKDRERERERARKEQEEKDRRRKENERRERKEAERREAERKAEEAKKDAEQRRLEEEAEAQRAAAETRRIAEEEEKARLAAEEEERSRRAAEAEKRRIAAEEERKRAEEAAAEDERRRLKEIERRKREDRKRKTEEEEARLKEKKRDKERAAATPDLSSQFGLERLKGELSLKTLSPNKMKQLEDMGKTNGRIMSIKENTVVQHKTVSLAKDLKNESKLKELSKDSTPRSKNDKGEKRKSEKERDRGSENADKERKKDKKNKVAVIKAEDSSTSQNSSRPSSAAPQTPPSTSKGREFRCACNECKPTKKVCLEQVSPAEAPAFYTNLARTKKKIADQESDLLLKLLMYIESGVYFAISSHSTAYGRDNNSQHELIQQSSEMVKVATNRFIYKDFLTPLMYHLAPRARSLSLRIQSVLAFNMYQSKCNAVWKFHDVVDTFNDFRPIRLPSGDKSNEDDVSGSAVIQPSPASSVHSCSNSGASRMVSIPEELYLSQKQERKIASNLLFAHRIWADAIDISERNDDDMEFFNCLNSVCGHLSVHTRMSDLAIFVLTSITWLRQEYELEKRRPQPPGENKRLSNGASRSNHS